MAVQAHGLFQADNSYLLISQEVQDLLIHQTIQEYDLLISDFLILGDKLGVLVNLLENAVHGAVSVQIHELVLFGIVFQHRSQLFF